MCKNLTVFIAFLMMIGSQVSADILQLLCTEDEKGITDKAASHHIWFMPEGVGLTLNERTTESYGLAIKYGSTSEESGKNTLSSSIEFIQQKVTILYSISDLNNLGGSQIQIQIDRATGAFEMVKTMVGANYFSNEYEFDSELFERTKISGRCEVLLDELKF